MWCGAPYSVKKEPLRGASFGRRSAEQQEEHARPVVLFLLVRGAIAARVRTSVCARVGAGPVGGSFRGSGPRWCGPSR